ncbi:hypothetical protein B0A53_01714 [Rhodotorula sp. CCFEE 5036]|nr:hypothetical protein B0A53_01714 [Rhodotorula sp. CCFEE 5036]
MSTITAIGTVSRATQLGLFATTTVTETTTVLQLVYFREPATTASSSHNSTASNVQQALEKVADQYEGSTLAELGSMAAVFLIVILIGTVAFVFSINYARRARTMVEGGSEEAWAENMSATPRDRMMACMVLPVPGADETIRSHAHSSYLHLALGRPAPPSEEEDAPAANDDGAGGVAAKEEQKPTATAAPSTAKNEAEKSSSTETATAAWATQTSGGMQQSSDKQDTIILHSDASLSYGCPKSGDKWEQESLTDSLTAHTATGAGCWMRYTFQGDSVQVYGASGLQAGVFGCSVNSGSTNTTGWWNAYGSANFYRPYSGSCSIQGIGYDKHTIQLTNSPYQPKKVYFTGLRMTTNQTQPIWETLKWEACCQKFTFPDGVATTVGASASTGTTNANGLLTGLDGSTFSFIIAAIAAVVIAAAALIAVMCCKPRKTNPSVNLQHILSGDGKSAS